MRKKILLSIVAAPAALLVLHAVLAVFDLFPPVRLLKDFQHGGNTYIATNPDYLRPFFQRTQVPSPEPAWIKKEKAPGVRRVILLGESAAAGFPVTDFNLARLVEIEWNRRHPGEPVEVINLAASAINSHIIRIMAIEAIRELDPDLVILYAGHNEVIGPFGPASKFGLHANSLTLIRARIAIRNSRIGQALAALAGKFSPTQSGAPTGWSGLNEFKDLALSLGDPRLETMYDHAGRNFRSIVDRAVSRGAGCVIAIPAVNLNDWEPIGSDPEDTDIETIAAAAKSGNLEKHRSATLVYRAGKKIQELEGIQAAWKLFRRACDLDTKRLRADSRLRDQRRILAEGFGDRVTIVDTDRWLHEMNPGFFSDREYFLEHVHLTFEGRAAVAIRIADGMESLWKGHTLDESPEAASVWWSEFKARSSELRKRTLFTGYDDHDMWSLAWKLLRLEVFQSAEGMEERRQEMAARTTYLRGRARLDWGPEPLKVACARAAELNPDDPLVHFTAGRLLGMAGEFGLAEQAFRLGFSLQPNFTSAWLNYAMLSLGQKNPAGAREALAVLENFDPHANGIEDLRKAIK